MWYEIDSLARDGDAHKAIVRVPADSPWFDGHFPDRPVLPGIAQLAMVEDLLSRALPGGGRVVGLRRVRFKQAVGPGATLTVVARPQRGSIVDVAFRILDGEALVCSGIAIRSAAVTTGQIE
jgi:3-hydroxyacyl-[acyl-carrier-protein] dehydratase